MEFKIRANIVMSRELTIEAEGLNEAMEKAQTMMSEPIPRAELTYRKVYFDNIREDGKEFVLK
jgi:hypothetical protein